MNYTYTQLARVSPRSYRRQAVAGACEPSVETVSARGGRGRRRLSARSCSRSCISSLLPPFAWLAKRAAKREPAWLDRRSPPTVIIRPRASTEMKILGISAHYHDSAAALVVDGVPVCAVQEERLSRRKNDAGFPLAAIEWCLDHAGARPGGPRRRGLLRAQHAEVRAHSHVRAAGVSRSSWRSFPHAMKNSLGEKVWVRGIISSQLGVPRREDPVHRAPPVARGRGVPHRADASRGDPDRGRRRRMGDADGRATASGGRTEQRPSRCCAKSDFRTRSACSIRPSPPISASP